MIKQKNKIKNFMMAITALLISTCVIYSACNSRTTYYTADTFAIACNNNAVHYIKYNSHEKDYDLYRLSVTTRNNKSVFKCDNKTNFISNNVKFKNLSCDLEIDSSYTFASNQITFRYNKRFTEQLHTYDKNYPNDDIIDVYVDGTYRFSVLIGQLNH